MSAAKMGDPLSDDTEMGPLARHDLRDTVHRRVEGSIAKGARCLLGGTIPNSREYYPPAVLSDASNGMPAFDYEVFWPVAAVVPFKEEEQAIETANDSPFGLGGGAFTRDLAGGEHIAAELIDSGMVFANEHCNL